MGENKVPEEPVTSSEDEEMSGEEEDEAVEQSDDEAVEQSNDEDDDQVFHFTNHYCNSKLFKKDRSLYKCRYCYGKRLLLRTIWTI